MSKNRSAKIPSRRPGKFVTIRRIPDRYLEGTIYEIELHWDLYRDMSHPCAVDYDNLVQERERRADRRMGDGAPKVSASSARELRKSKNTAWGSA